jgi:hypothetical protein
MTGHEQEGFISVDGQPFTSMEEKLQRDLVVAACDVVAKLNTTYDRATLLGLYDYRVELTAMISPKEVGKMLTNENLILAPVDAFLKGAHLEDVKSQ